MVDFLEQIKLILTIFREVIVTDALLKVFVIVDLNSVSMQSDFTFCKYGGKCGMNISPQYFLFVCMLYSNLEAF